MNKQIDAALAVVDFLFQEGRIGWHIFRQTIFNRQPQQLVRITCGRQHFFVFGKIAVKRLVNNNVGGSKTCDV